MSEQREEKPERRHREREEKGGEGMQEKWERDPISAGFGAVFLIVLGILLFLGVRGVILWEDWWKYLLVSIGGLLLIEVLVRFTRPAYRRPVVGRLIAGIILISIGLANLGGIGQWWPLIPIVIGVIILIGIFARRR
jgi:hypothetical protein